MLQRSTFKVSKLWVWVGLRLYIGFKQERTQHSSRNHLPELQMQWNVFCCGFGDPFVHHWIWWWLGRGGAWVTTRRDWLLYKIQIRGSGSWLMTWDSLLLTFSFDILPYHSHSSTNPQFLLSSSSPLRLFNPKSGPPKNASFFFTFSILIFLFWSGGGIVCILQLIPAHPPPWVM